MFRRSTIVALLGLSFLSACGTVDERLRTAAEKNGQVEATKQLPEYPPGCRKQERSGVRQGDPADYALELSDKALGRANDRIRWCGHWYDEIKTGFEGGSGE